MTAKEILLKAKELLATPGKWTTRAYARDKVGNAVNASAPDACMFCAYGACLHFEDNVFYPSESAACIALGDAAARMNTCVVELNDYQASGVESVLALYDKAIEICG